MCIDSIEVLNKQQIECAQKSKTKKKDEENMYKREINNEIKQITSKPPITEPTTPTSYCNINLPQISLSTFDGEPQQWTDFGMGSMRFHQVNSKTINRGGKDRSGQKRKKVNSQNGNSNIKTTNLKEQL